MPKRSVEEVQNARARRPLEPEHSAFQKVIVIVGFILLGGALYWILTMEVHP